MTSGMKVAKNNMYGVQEEKQVTLQEFLGQDAVKKQMKALLKDRAGYFAMALMQVVDGNEQLKNAEPQSIFNAGIASAILGLPIEKNLGFSYIVPYGDKAQFQIGYKGFIQLALRTGQYKLINSTAIKEGEIKLKNRLTGEIEFNFIEDDDLRDTLKTIGYASYIEFNNGFRNTLYMSMKQVQAHAQKYSKSFGYKNSVWTTNFDAMALKTVLKLNLAKFGALSVDFEKALQLDGATINKVQDNGTLEAEYSDNGEDKIKVLGSPDERDKPTTKEMQELLIMGNEKNIDVFRKAKELFGVASLLTLNMVQYDMLKRTVERM